MGAKFLPQSYQTIKWMPNVNGWIVKSHNHAHSFASTLKCHGWLESAGSSRVLYWLAFGVGESNLENVVVGNIENNADYGCEYNTI